MQFVNNDPFARARIVAVQSGVAAAPVVSGSRAPPPTPAFSPFRDADCWCSKCPRRGSARTPGLMRHLRHAGSIVAEPTCSLFVAIERVTCTRPLAEGFDMRVRGCAIGMARPPQRDPLRLMTSSCVPWLLVTQSWSTLTPTPRLACSSGRGTVTRLHHMGSLAPSKHSVARPLELPLRRMIASAAQCWHGMAQGSNESSQLEEGRSKLLLSPLPPGPGTATEMPKRLALWEQRRFESLLQRADDGLPDAGAKELLPTSSSGRPSLLRPASGSSTCSARRGLHLSWPDWHTTGAHH